jgi:hypothetical protein
LATLISKSVVLQKQLEMEPTVRIGWSKLDFRQNAGLRMLPFLQKETDKLRTPDNKRSVKAKMSVFTN